LGEGLVVGFADLTAGGVGAGALGDEGDDEGEDAVEVVEAFLRLVVGDDEEGSPATSATSSPPAKCGPWRPGMANRSSSIAASTAC
jgi:hypothetical protein